MGLSSQEGGMRCAGRGTGKSKRGGQVFIPKARLRGVDQCVQSSLLLVLFTKNNG